MDEKEKNDILKQSRNLIQSNQAGKALEKVQEVHKSYPDDRKVLDLLGFLYFSKKQYRKAEQFCRRSIALFPDNYYAYKGLGLCLAYQGKIEEGISCISKSIEMNPRFFDSRYDLAVILYQADRLEEAKDALKQAIIIDPSRKAIVGDLLASIAEKKENRDL